MLRHGQATHTDVVRQSHPERTSSSVPYDWELVLPVKKKKPITA